MISPLSCVATLADLDEAGAAYDAAVDESLDLDRFCSQRAFVVAAFLGLQPGRTARFFRTDSGGWLLFAEREVAMLGDPRPRRLWEPLEAMWGLSCPLVGADEPALGAALAQAAHEAHDQGGSPVVLLCGLRRGSLRMRTAVAALSATHRISEGTGTQRQVASLEGGLDGFLARRSAGFRSKIRRARRQAEARGLRYERHAPTTVDDVRRLYDRAATLDDDSWKGRAETGLRGSGLYAFYEHMLPRLAARGELRMSFLVDGGQDVAYLFGGVRHGTFRGLQFAFRAGHEARSLGNVAQLMEVEQLCKDGALRYDLGVSAEYKQHWGEELDETMSLIAAPRRGF